MIERRRRSWYRRTVKYVAVFWMSIMNQMVYSADMVFRSLFYILIIGIYTQLWGTLLQNGRTLGGLSRGDLVWYLVYTEAILLAVPRFDDTVSTEVKSGEIAYRLLRPMSYVGFHAANYLGEISVRWLMNLLAGGLLVRCTIGPCNLDVAHLPGLLAITFLGFVLSFQISMLIALSAMWVEETRPFFWIYHKLLFTVGGLLIPNDLLPPWLKRCADALPFSIILYAPARLSVRWEGALAARTLVTGLVWCALLGMMTDRLFRTGVRRLNVHGG